MSRGIKLGAYIDLELGLGGSVAEDWALWTEAQGKRPYYYTDWLDPRVSLSDGLTTYEGGDLLEQQRVSGAPGLFVNFNLFPVAGEQMVDVLEGSTTTSGMSAPEYVKTLASALKAYTDTSGSVVPVRFLHEMNMAEKPWQSIDPDTYRRLFRQWASILHAGNPRLRTVWCIAGGGARDFDKYYPGDTAVDWVGCDIYPGMRPAAAEYEFSNLDAAHDLAGRRSKPFVIPEFSRPRGTIDEVPDDPRYLQRLGEWMVSRRRLVAVCNFEVYNHNGDWRLSDGTHQRMLEMWRSYARRPIFEGDL